MAKTTKPALHIGRSIMTLRLEWYGDDRKLVDALKHGAARSERNYQQHAKYLIRRAIETGIDGENA